MPITVPIDRRVLCGLAAAVILAAPVRALDAQGDPRLAVVTVVAPPPTPLRIAALSVPATPVTRPAAPRADSLGAERPAAPATQPAAPTRSPQGGIDRPRLATGAYYALLGGAVAANAVGHFIDDPGGYPKQWDQWTVFHVIGGWGLDALGEKLAVPVTYKRIPVRPLAVCSAVIAWEHAKGFADWRDMAAGCTGAMASAGSTWLFRALF